MDVKEKLPADLENILARLYKRLVVETSDSGAVFTESYRLYSEIKEALTDAQEAKEND
jgi:hypothetical protein